MIGPLSRRRPQIMIITRQQHLYKIVVVQPAITIQIEVVYKLVEIIRFEFSKTVLTRERTK